MPYFWNKEKKINILFIHIPKTGGTSVEKYFANLTEQSLGEETVYGMPTCLYLNKNLPLPQVKDRMYDCSLQHLPYEDLLRWSRSIFNIRIFNDIKLEIFTIVRNPYHRIVSDLFFWKLIDTKTTPKQVTIILKKYLQVDYDTISNKIDDYNPPKNCIQRIYHFFDNHRKSQCEICAKLTKSGCYVKHPEIIYMKTETLKEDMIKNGFLDFDIHEGKNSEEIVDYLSYLNEEAIHLINCHFAPDFELFGYPKIPTSIMKYR